jgi:hypothetical protein
MWAAYAPLVPYFFYLAARRRTLSAYTAANPGMFSGGLAGESKSETLTYLSRIAGAVAPFSVVPAGSRFTAKMFPIVLKPDVGERGTGVVIARTQAEVDDYLDRAVRDTIVQEYVAGHEFGIYYVRYPEEPRGRVLFITAKQFPFVTGDGKSTLRDLILAGSRSVCMADAYFRVAKRPLDSIPASGEQVGLSEIGSHCRGSIFLDASHLLTRELNDAIDRVSQAHPGFYLGRYDVRTPSVEALQRGAFTVIELNGVAGEATHVYDPKVSLLEKYGVMARHWRMAFEIGSINRSRGARGMSARELLRFFFPKRSGRGACATYVA